MASRKPTKIQRIHARKKKASEKADRDAKVIALWDNDNGLNASEIERETGVPRATVNRILKPLKTGDQSSTPLLDSTYRAVEKWSPPQNTDNTGVESVQPKKADRDAQVIALHQQGESLRKIHAEIGKSLGISYGTIASIVKAYKSSTPLLDSTYRAVEKLYTSQNTDAPCIESQTLHLCEPEPDHDTFFKLLDISACFYGKHQVSPSDVSQLTGIDESEVRRILDDWYQNVAISPGIGEKYWMTERDKKNLWDKILAPTHKIWEQDFPEQKILCPPTLYNPHINANSV